MKRYLMTNLLMLTALTVTQAQDRTIDISGDNTDKTATQYATPLTINEGETVDVKMARYSYFSSKITGTGRLNIHAGGERGYLGNSDKKWNEWGDYTGPVHIYPYRDNCPSASMYAAVLMNGGKQFSADNIELNKVNRSLENNQVTLHEGATLCTEANTAGSGFRIGSLNTEVGSTLQGYMKNGRSAYYMLGLMNTDFTLAGRIAPADYRDDTMLGIIKEGTGTMTITGNSNYLSGALRILDGRVMIMNDPDDHDWSEPFRGALGAKPDPQDAIAFVFGKGVLGGTGLICGSVDNYGTIEPGAGGIGILSIYNTGGIKKTPNLFLHPGSVLRMEVASAAYYDFDQLQVQGEVKYSNTTEDFMTSDKMPVIDVVVSDDANLKVGDEIPVLTGRKSSGDWHFDVRANKYTWEVYYGEYTESGYAFYLRLVSLDNMAGPDTPDNPEIPESTMGAFYNDPGIDEMADKKSLKYYANQNGKCIGTAISLYKNDLTNSSLAETEAVGFQFNMLVAENEMKPEAFGGQNGKFNLYNSTDASKIVNFARTKKMAMRGHCLVWNQQSPTWISSDGGKTNDKNWTRQQALDIMKNHITNVVGFYKGKVREWDVVNECLDDNQPAVRTNPEGYDMKKNCVWQQAIGDDYVDSAFVYAHQADPDAELYLNDYGVELQGKAKSAAFYNLAVRMKNAGIPIDGVGLQCHFSIGDVDSLRLDQTVSRFEEVGLKCIITELDMGIPDTSDASLEEQARSYRVITDIMLNHDNCPSMVIWGLKDNNSWRESSSPLLFTAQLDKKPAYYAVRSALRHRALIESGIRAVRQTVKNDGNIYNLAGQKVGADYQGIVIIDGRKVMNNRK